MAKKAAILVIILVALGYAGFWLSQQGKNPLGEAIEVYAYTISGQSNGGASLAVPFVRDVKDGDNRLLNLAIDLDGNGSVSDQEWVVRNARPRIVKDTRNLLHFSLPKGQMPASDKPLTVYAMLTPEALENWDGTKQKDAAFRQVEAKLTKVELADVLGFDVPGGGPDVYRGGNGTFLREFLGIREALADPIDVQSDLEIPDYPQGDMECGPTSAANNITGLTNAHGAGSRLPPTPRDMIEELKTDMRFNNGVFGAQNFVDGKNAFAARHNLPITTRVIERPSIQDIAQAIQDGCAVEMDLAFLEVVNGRAGRHVASHTVTVSGVYSDGPDKGIYGADSATPDGLEIWRFSDRGPNLQIAYPLWDGATVVVRIFVQCWTAQAQDESATAPPEDASTTGSGGQAAEGTPVEMLVIGGVYYPKHQFRVADPDACGQPHYHAGVAHGLAGRDSLEVVSSPDPNPTGCGFGAVSEVPVETIVISHEQSLELIKFLVD